MAATTKLYPIHVQQDASLSQAVALAASAGTVNTNSIDLGTPNTGPFPTTGKFTVQLTTGASSNGANVQANISLQHSADNSNWAAIPGLGLVAVANTNVAGAANVALPPGCYRYIRGQAVTSGTGNVIDASLTVKALF